MAERSKALRSGRSPLLWAWVRIPLLSRCFHNFDNKELHQLVISKGLQFILELKISESKFFHYAVTVSIA
ncbi:hypothetical protein T07_2912 [Trichinella nelsoni]|uniref:Uncharacterized protein n=1 Tax=Trichinella nelsoni TaxID=6336 RepID=A0A0V0S535_9BILA|nr:hypothetical protein T07_2912 [Trichinella nelsoni]